MSMQLQALELEHLASDLHAVAFDFAEPARSVQFADRRIAGSPDRRIAGSPGLSAFVPLLVLWCVAVLLEPFPSYGSGRRDVAADCLSVVARADYWRVSAWPTPAGQRIEQYKSPRLRSRPCQGRR